MNEPTSVSPVVAGSIRGDAGARGTSLATLSRLTALLSDSGVAIPLVMLVVVVGAFHPTFLSRDSLTNVALQAAYYGIMALGAVFLLSMGELDLSIGAIYAVSSIGTAVLMQGGVDPWLAAMLGVCIGIGLGAVNGILANVLGIATIVITLGTISMYRGLTVLIPRDRSFTELPLDHPFFTFLGGDQLGVPVPVWSFGFAAALLHVVYRSTRYGYVLRAIGSNPQAARLSGISIPRIRLMTLMLMGGLCGISGVLTFAYIGSTDPTIGTGYEILVIAAAIIGGTALSGGSGTIVGAVLGALLISVIRSGLTFFGVNSSWTGFVTGSVVVFAVGIDALVRRRRRASIAHSAREAHLPSGTPPPERRDA